jgi:hypothetical protein
MEREDIDQEGKDCRIDDNKKPEIDETLLTLNKDIRTCHPFSSR